MVLDVRRALRTGYDDLTSTAGLNVCSVLLVVNLLSGAVVASFRRGLFEAVRQRGPGQSPAVFVEPPLGWDALVFDLPLVALAVLAVGVVVTGEAVRFWAIRLFADRPARSLPDVGARLPVLVAVGGGFALALFGLRQVLPVLWIDGGAGAVVLASQVTGVVTLALVGVAVYLRQEIALTDADAWETVRRSVRRFVAAPVPILGLLALLGLLGALVALPTAVAAYALAGSGAVVAAARLVAVVLSTLVSTFSIATVTDAYVQTRRETLR